MALNNLEHFLVRANNLDDTRAFYENVLGLRVGERPNFPFAGDWLYLGGVPCVHLVQEGFEEGLATFMGREEGETQPHDNTGAIDHIAFNATDLDGMRKRFADFGLETHEQGIGNLRQIFIKDPNGVRIELNFRTSGAGE